MSDSLPTKIVRYFFFAFNLVVWILGVLVIVVGAFGYQQAGLFVVCNVLVGVGALVTLLGFMGCCGALCKIRPLLSGELLYIILIPTCFFCFKLLTAFFRGK